MTTQGHSTTCADCGLPIDEPPGTTDRKPCPNCGSKARNFSVQINEILRAVDAVSGEVGRVSEEVDLALTSVRLAVLAILLTLASAAGFDAGFAEHSVLLGLAWGLGAFIVSIPALAFLLRARWVRDRTSAVMRWILGS